MGIADVQFVLRGVVTVDDCVVRLLKRSSSDKPETTGKSAEIVKIYTGHGCEKPGGLHFGAGRGCDVRLLSDESEYSGGHVDAHRECGTGGSADDDIGSQSPRALFLIFQQPFAQTDQREYQRDLNRDGGDAQCRPDPAVLQIL